MSQPVSLPASFIERLTSASAVERRRTENEVFQKYRYLVRQGGKKYGITDEHTALGLYCDALSAAIDQTRQQRFAGDAAWGTYLAQIFYNKCVTFLRSEATNKNEVNRQTTDVTDTLPLAAPIADALQKLVAAGEQERLLAALTTIGEPCKQLLLLWGEGFAYTEIAEMTPNYKTAEVVRVSVARCKQKLVEKWG